MPQETMEVLKRTRVCQRPLEIAPFTGELPARSERPGRPFGARKFGGRDRPFKSDRGGFRREGGDKGGDKGGRRFDKPRDSKFRRDK